MPDEKAQRLLQMREAAKDDYLLTEIICTACGGKFIKQTANFCPLCGVTIFERGENGSTRLIAPSDEEKTLYFKLKLPSGEEKRRAGEIVEIGPPSLFDCNIKYFLNGEEMTGLKFLMPARDVEITAKAMPDMSNRGSFPMGMGMNMGNMGINGK